MTKQELRQQYRAKRLALDARDRLRLDDLLLLQFQQLDYSHIETVLTYWPMAVHAEPNTHLFTAYLRHMVPGLQIAYPVADMATMTMEAVLIQEDTVYHTNEWGITEPRTGVRIPATQPDLVLVPLLVCDNAGYRVGYGKGFYDRYLAQCRQDAVKMGFSYFEPVERITDSHQFDVPLSFCITPQQIYEF